ncbi:MAG: hypothetical protein ABIJ61_09470, partial [bacterium]
LMEPTIPELEGLIDREQLENISGRSRKRQMEMAEEFGLHDYASPASGCLLTDRGYSTKLRDILEHKAQVTFDDLNLLKVGRHFRLSPTCKAIVGRREEENDKLEKYISKYTCLKVIEHGSPLTLILGEHGEREIEIAAGITARFSDGKELPQLTVGVWNNGSEHTVEVAPLAPEQIDKFRLVWEKRSIDGRYAFAGSGRSSD